MTGVHNGLASVSFFYDAVIVRGMQDSAFFQIDLLAAMVFRSPQVVLKTYNPNPDHDKLCCFIAPYPIYC